MVRPWVVFAIGVLVLNGFVEARMPQLAAKNIAPVVIALSALATGFIELLVWALRRIKHRVALRAENGSV